MKKSLLTALLAALSISLVSCVNNPAPATTPNSTPTQTTPDNSGKDDDKVTLKTITYSGDPKVGGQLSLVAKDSNGALITPQTAVTYTATKGADLVTIQGAKVNLLKAGDVTIQGSYEGSTAEVSFTIEAEQLEASISIKEAKSKPAGTTVVVKGKVLSAVGKSAYIADATAGLYIYNWSYNSDGSDTAISNSTWTVGDSVIVKANINMASITDKNENKHNGGLQLSNYSGGRIDGTYAKKITEDITTTSPISLDEAGFKNLKDTEVGNLYSFSAKYVSGNITAGKASSL